jgi:hypothetical protein
LALLAHVFPIERGDLTVIKQRLGQRSSRKHLENRTLRHRVARRVEATANASEGGIAIRGQSSIGRHAVVGLLGVALAFLFLMGIVALFWGLVLAATSSDFAMAALGGRAWKHVQQYSYVVFCLVGLHGAYFLFLHYDLSLRGLVFQKAVPEPNWFRFWFVGAAGLVMALQTAAFFTTMVRRGRARVDRTWSAGTRARQGVDADE